jgi:chaperonin GroES
MRIWDLNTRLSVNRDLIEAPNLVDRFDEQDLSCIGDAVYNGYAADQGSRSAWLRRNSAGMDLAMQIQKDKNFPWPGCSNVVFPLISIAALQFSARSYSNIITGPEIVKYRVGGEDPQGVLQERADRISRHMSWQVLVEDRSWEEQHDLMLINLAIVGCNFIKTYFSPSMGHNDSDLVMARDLVIDYWAKSVDKAARKTHIIPLSRNEIYERCVKNIFRKGVLEEAWFQAVPSTTSTQQQSLHDQRTGQNPSPPDEDTPFRTLEQHRLLDLDKDGYAEPYIVTIEETSRRVLRITSRIEREEDIERIGSRIAMIKATEFFTKFSFVPAPDGGIYDIGFGTLIGPLNESVNSGINQLLDAGTMANSNGGFLGRGAKIRGGQYTFAPWEWKRVDSTGDDLRKSLVQLPVREPSGVLFNLIGLLIQYTDRLAGTVDTMVGENPGQNTKTGVANQTLEQGMQVYSSIFKRVWRSLQSEFSKLHQLNRIYLPIRQRFGDEGHFILREDYNSNPELVAPATDPRIVSDQMRAQQAEALANRAAVIPGYNRKLVERNLLKAMRIDAVDKFFPGEDVIPAPPSPEVQKEQLKMQVRKMELDHEKWQTIAQLQAQVDVNRATVDKLKAETAAIIASIGAEKAATQVKAFEAAINAIVSHNQTINERMKALKEVSTSEESDTDTGSV